MANVGTVQSVTGIVKAIAEDGTERILSIGDTVAENEKIVTGDGVIVIAFTDGTVLDLGSNSSIVLNEDVLNQEGEQIAQNRADANDEVAALQEALANNPDFDPTAELPATAAGPAAGGTEGNNGHSIVSVDYLNPKAPVESGFDTLGISQEFLQPDEELPPVIEDDPVIEEELNPPVDYDASVTAQFVEEAPFEFNLENPAGSVGDEWPATSISVPVDNGENQVAYVYFTLDADAAVSISTDGPTIDPQIHLFRDDGSLDLGDWLATDDDDGPSAGSFDNSIINTGDEVGVLPAGNYILAVSDYSLLDSEAVSGGNSNSLVGDVVITIASPTATVTINEGTSADPATATTGIYVLYDIGGDDGIPELGAGYIYEFQVGESENVIDNIHGTDVEDGVTADFTITSLPASADDHQIGLLLIDRNDDGTIEEIYGEGFSPLPAGGLSVLSGDSVYYFQQADYGYGDERQITDEVYRVQLEAPVLMDPVPVTFNYFTTDSDGFVSDGAVISIGFPQLPSPPEASVGVGANEDGVLEEDTQGALHFTATPVESDDTITAITIEGFPVGPDGWLVDAGSVTLTGGSVDSVFYNSSTGELTILVTGATPGVVVTGTVDVTPNADSDVDVGLIINATATDEGLSATSSNGPTTVGVDAILDEAVRFVDGEDDDSEPDAIVVTADESYTEQDIQLGGDIAEVFSPFGQNDGAGDTNETGELTIVVTGGLPDGVSLSSFDGELVLDAGSTDTYTLTGTASELEAIADSLFVTVPEGFDGGFDGTLSVSFEDPAVDAIEVLGNNVSSSSTTFSVNIAPGEDIDFESLDEESVETDGSVNIDLAGTISISDADGSEQFTSVEYTFNGLPAGTTAFGGVLVGNVLTVTLTAGELPASYGLTLPTDYSTTGVAGSTTNNGADITFDVAVTTNEGSDSESGTITVGVEGDINVEVATIAAQDETDAVVTFTLSDKLTVEETDADTSEQVTSVTVTLSGVPEGSVMTGWTEVGVDSGHYTWTGTSTAGVPDVGIAADWSGTVTGNVAGTTDEGGADNKNFSLTVDPTEDIDFNLDALNIDTVETDSTVAVDLAGTVSISDADGSEQFTSVEYTFNGLPAGTTAFGGVLVGNVLTVTLTAGELPASYGLTLPTDYSTTGVAGSTTNNGADITFDVAVTTNEGSDSESGTITVGVEGDINVEVATIAAQDETDAVVTFTLSDKLTVEETDADTSEQVTSVTVTLSGVPEGSVMTGWTEVGVDSGHYTWTGTSTAGVPDVGIAADWSGTVTGNVAGTTDEGGADNKNFSLTVDPTEDIDFNLDALNIDTVETDSTVAVDLAGHREHQRCGWFRTVHQC
ncbi:retention module-containing protein [Cycloclasticus sp. P1]|uniref:retention module-containing protein n=1 Tax=Cycloclasticus sp. (strain P1) TaxID=385025 RepID=UPI000286ACE8|nr:retention module-containing protein [Cycloclasticus sp. P1]AFT68056.1 Type I secretion target GGXGXDXXX repeat protein domain protein [Cycloclasticus sp. P1]